MKDELIKNFSQAIVQLDDPASAAEPSDVSGLPSGGSEPRAVFGLPRELPSLFGGVNAGPPTNLPEQVSQSQIASENRKRWSSDGAAKDGE